MSDTTVRPRADKYLYDLDCVNEAVLNALVHNDWTITEPQISMFDDRIEILSHGGLPNGMTKDAFFEGISRPRNATLMRVFLNLGLVEHTGHGIPTIVERYGKEVFEIAENYISCVIPFDEEVTAHIGTNVGMNKNVGMNVGMNVGLKPSEKKVLSAIIENPDDSAVKIAEKTGISKRTVERALVKLQELGMVERICSKRDGRWIVIR